MKEGSERPRTNKEPGCNSGGFWWTRPRQFALVQRGKFLDVLFDELERSESQDLVWFEDMCEAALSKAELGLGTSNRFESWENNPGLYD